MKRYRGLIIAAVICVILGGVYFFLSSGQDAADTGLFWTPRRGEEVTAVDLENEFGAFMFSLEKDGRWMVESDGEFRTNPEKMKLFTAALNHLPIKRVLDSQLPEYGLDEPRARVSFTTNKGRTLGFEVGGTTASMSDVYIRDLVSGKVMLTGIGSAAQLTGSIAAYRDKEVLTVDGYNINRIAWYEDGVLVVAAEKPQGGEWKLTEPFPAPARQVILGEVVSAIRKWGIAGYPEGRDYASMGLDQPTRRLELADGAGTVQRIEIGGDASSTTTYARTGGTDEVVMLFSVDLDFSMLTPEALMFVAPLRTTIEMVQAISISTPAGESVFTIDRSQGEELITIGAKEYSLMEFSSVFVKYIGMSAEGRDPAPRPDGPPEAVLKTWYTDGKVTELHLLHRDANSYYMDWGEGIEFYMRRDALPELLSRVQNLR